MLKKVLWEQLKKVIVKKIAEKRDRKRAQNRPKKLKVAIYKKKLETNLCRPLTRI